MKKIILLIIITCSVLFSQSWNTSVFTNIYEPYFNKMDVFSNNNGIHLLIRRSNGTIVYYRLNSQGQLTSSSNPAPFSTSGNFPCLTGTNNIIYAFYNEGSYIKGKYSDNGGNTWGNLPDIQTSGNECNGVDAVWAYNNIHLVWATKDNVNNFATHYKMLTPYKLWVNYKNVTDIDPDGGGDPNITITNDKVHVAYSQYYQIHYREKTLSTNQWGSIENVPYDDEAFVAYVPIKQIYNDGNYIRVVYKYVHSNWESTEYIGQAYRAITGGSWTEDTNTSLISNTLKTVQTYDKRIHVFYNDEALNDNLHKTILGTTWTTVGSTTFNSDNCFFASASNDIYSIEFLEVNHGIFYQQYDANPLAPQNVAVTSNGNSNPVISWSANTEPDLSGYRVYKKLTTESGIQTTYITTTSTSYTDTDFEITSPRLATDEVEYWVIAVDLNNHLSPESSHIIKTGESLIQWKKSLEEIIADNPTEFRLSQNYPNPFNPSTTISYEIPEAGFVQLKVYNSIGQEITTLVNEYKEAGKYNYQFSIGNYQLPSGVYFYKLQSGSFVQTRKMLLMK